jgi:carbon-monoxide dehydrogenase medium subunit
MLTKDGQTCSSAAIALTNLSDTPIWSQGAGAALIGTDCGPAAIKAAVAAGLEDIDPSEDNRGPIAFKYHAARMMISRAIASAWARA